MLFPVLLKCQGRRNLSRDANYLKTPLYCSVLLHDFLSFYRRAQRNVLFFYQRGDEWFDCLALICTGLLIARVNEGFTSGVITLLGRAASIEASLRNRVGL